MQNGESALDIAMKKNQVGVVLSLVAAGAYLIQVDGVGVSFFYDL